MATTTARDDRTPAAALLGELSGAVADLGTFLPLVIGVLAVGGFDAAGVLTGFGLFALAVAVFYRRPVPVQPMKAVSALAI
ncbi:MAG: sulfate transporter, partial [Hyphomicrobiales bacterium]|nr:sulfate transporter [Hyphomicrobiales bacterium]